MNAPEPVAAYANGLFPADPLGTATGWRTVNAFPNLTFTDPMWLTGIPGTTQVLVVGKSGTLWRFANSSSVPKADVVTVLDWKSKTEVSEDQGFYSAVFHPNFGRAGQTGSNDVFVCYSHRPVVGVNDDNRTYWRVSRFKWLTSTGKIDPNSESVLINQYDPHRWHNGGAMFFGNNGFLHITAGDGGDANDSLGNAQRITRGFFSGMFRIDVDNNPAKSHAIRRQPTEDSAWQKPTGANWPASSTKGYGIPNDNPWLNTNGSILEEFFAIGLRSPHTAHFDPVTGEIWVGDVGQKAREELMRVSKGSNGQWAFREGSVAGPKSKPGTVIGVERLPDYEYPRTVGTCIIGGMRYRGAKWNSTLGGKVLFGDHVRGTIWTFNPDASGTTPAILEIVAGFDTGRKVGLANFCTDSAGEIYLMNLAGTDVASGTILKLSTQGTTVEPPRFLSQTKIFTNLQTLQTLPGAIPYDVANPLWSDKAEKRRWIILPNNGTYNSAAEDIVFSEEGNWVFPAGTVFVKHFEVPVDETDPSRMKRLETRFIICTENGGKYGVTYKWNSAGTDAELLATGLSESYQVKLAGGGTTTRNWDYPSRADCLLCHNPASGQALGFRTAPLNRSFHYTKTGRTANQLTTLNALGAFDTTLTPSQIGNFLAARSLDDETAPLEHRVRSYFDSNCAHCHQPGATVDAFDARLGTALKDQGLINGLIQGDFVPGPNHRYIRPGEPALSVAHLRLAAVGNGDAMPPLAKNVIDSPAVAAVHSYILGLDPGEFETTPGPQGRYVRLTANSEVLGGPLTSVAEFSVLDGNGKAIPASELRVHAFDSEEANGVAPPSKAIDGDPETFWQTRSGSSAPAPPHFITLDLGSLRTVGGYLYTPRKQGSGGRIANYQVHSSTNGTSWTLMDAGTWSNGTSVQRHDSLAGRRPVRSLIAGPSGTVNGPFEVTVIFDRKVNDFTGSDLHVTGGVAAKFRGSGYYYVATIWPESATVRVSIPAGAVNSPGEGSLASGQLTFNFVDTLPPVAAFSDVPAYVTGGTLKLGLGFGEQVNGLDASDFVIGNGTLVSVTPDGGNFRISINPTSKGLVTIGLLAGAVTDTAGNLMGTGTSVSVPYLPQDSSKVLFLTGTGSFSGADAAVRDRLVARGMAVTGVKGTLATRSMAEGFGLVIVSSTISSSDLLAEMTGALVPLLGWESHVFDNLGMTGPVANVDFGFVKIAQATIPSSPNALTAGLPAGLTTLSSTSTDTAFGKPAPGAVVGATVTGGVALLFGYEQGAPMVIGNAPARRGGLPLYDQSFGLLTAAGLTLFDNAVDWARGTATIEEAQVAITSPADGSVVTGNFPLSFTVSGFPLGSEGRALAWYLDDLLGGVSSYPSPIALTALAAGPHTLRIELIQDSAPVGVSDSVTFTVNPLASNLPPVIVLNVPTQTLPGTSVTLHAAASYDPDNGPNPLVFNWQNLTGPVAATPVSATSSQTSVTLSVAGDYDFRLTISDGHLTASKDFRISARVASSEVLFVTSSGGFSGGDAKVRDHLVRRGMVVTGVKATSATRAMAEGYDLVLVSSTITSGDLRTEFAAAQVPLVSWESYIYDDLGMTGIVKNSDYGYLLNLTGITIANPTNPLTVGLPTGSLALLSAGADMAWGKPGAGAVIGATGSGNRALYFGYEAGAAMVRGTAPARRVGLPLFDDSFGLLTREGLTLFDNAVDWALGYEVPPIGSVEPPPPFEEAVQSVGCLFTESGNGGAVFLENLVRIRKDARDWPMVVETSVDCRVWKIETYERVILDDASPNFDLVAFRIPIDGRPTLFMRIAVDSGK